MRAAGAAMIVVLAMAGCSAKPVSGPPTTTPAPEQDHISFRWVDNPSVDLMSPEGTFVRAWLESNNQLGAGGGHGWELLAQGYPGFAHAFNRVSDLSDTSGQWPGDYTVAGTRYLEVVSFRRDGDQFTAEVCQYDSLVAGKWPSSDQWTYNGTGNPLSGGELLTFGPDPSLVPADQHAPKANQRGPAAAPSDNVFGTWIATYHTVVDGLENLYARCHKLAPGTPTDWPHGQFVRSTPPPVLSPSPGWPPGSPA